MNLIEQLGGYEKAKEILSRERNSENIDPVIYLNGNEILIDAICDALLEYRRQHNIFEVGDWVFPVVRIVDEIEGVGRYICAEKGELVVVREVKNKGAYCSHEHRLDNSFYMKFSEFRHATDAEIAAGKRRPELDSDTCSDIRNHISPLTKVIDR